MRQPSNTSLRGGLCPTWQSSFVNDKNSFYSTFCHPKGGAQMCRNRRCGARAEAACRLCRAARRKTMLRRNFGGRCLSSVKRLLRTFEAIKRSSFFNPPPAQRPVSLNFAVRERLTHASKFLRSKTSLSSLLFNPAHAGFSSSRLGTVCKHPLLSLKQRRLLFALSSLLFSISSFRKIFYLCNNYSLSAVC